MNKIRLLKKSSPQIKSAEQHSRQIITYLYTNNNDPQSMLQFQSLSASSHLLSHSKTINLRIIPSNPKIDIKHLPHFFYHLAKTKFYIHNCSFILFDLPKILLVSQEKGIIIKKKLFSLKILINWLGHLYFQRIQQKIINQIFEFQKHHKSQINKKTIHIFEEKSVMPSYIVTKKQDKALIRQVNLSDSPQYIKDSQLQKQIFCAIFFANGTQQLFYFSQILQFLDYGINHKQIQYIKILPRDLRQAKVFNCMYSVDDLTSQKMKIKENLIKIERKSSNWELLKENWEALKIMEEGRKSYESYGDLLMLQLVVSLQRQHRIVIKSLKLEWIVDQKSNFIISNVFLYQYQYQTLCSQQQPLDSLYYRLHQSKYQIAAKNLHINTNSSKPIPSASTQKLILPYITRSKTSQKQSTIKDHKYFYSQQKQPKMYPPKQNRSLILSNKIKSCKIKYSFQ